MLTKKRLIVIVGPTAVGKTALSLTLAKQFNGEVISGDSMQVYKGMDIGTAKASPSERREVPHHLIDIVHPDEPFSVSQFQKLAKAAIDDISRRGRVPFLVGGTGLYIQAVTHGYRFSGAKADERIRARWRRYSERYGRKALHEALHRVDPESAKRLHPNDVRRVVRALEIAERTGKTMTEHLRDQQRDVPYDILWIGLTMEREALYERINERVDAMIEEGMIDEVKRLREKDYTLDLVSMQGLGYKEIMLYLEGEWPLEEAIRQMKRNTRRFAKRQWTWFRRIDAIRWWDMTCDANRKSQIAEISEYVAGWLDGRPGSKRPAT